MKIFLTKLGWFSISTMILNGLLLFLIILLNKIAVNNCNLDDNINAVIVGDSHTMWSIDASNIGGVANISLNAEGYIYTYYKLKYLLNKEPNITHVYLGFGYHNLSAYYDEYIFGFRSKYFIGRYIGVMRMRDFAKIILENPKDILVIAKNIFQRGVRSGLTQRCTLYGSFPNEKRTETYSSAQMKKRILGQFFDDGKVINISENNLEYLNKIVSLLKRNNVEVTLLSTPLHKDYVALVPNEYKRYFDDYINQNQLKLYAFEDLILFDSDFLPDGDHVNYDGAMLTTAKFRDYHKNVDE